MEAFKLTHEERCAEIVEMCRNGWARPWKRAEHRVETSIKPCIECGQPFDGPARKKLCSYECKVKRDGKQAYKRMKRLRAERAEGRRG